MPVFWFLVSIVANFLTLAPALGGAFVGALWATRRPKAAFGVLGSTITLIGYFSLRPYLAAGDVAYGEVAYSMASQCCAMVPWVLFTALLAMFLPEELSGSTRGGPNRWLARIPGLRS